MGLVLSYELTLFWNMSDWNAAEYPLAAMERYASGSTSFRMTLMKSFSVVNPTSTHVAMARRVPRKTGMISTMSEHHMSWK